MIIGLSESLILSKHKTESVINLQLACYVGENAERDGEGRLGERWCEPVTPAWELVEGLDIQDGMILFIGNCKFKRLDSTWLGSIQG